MKKVLSIVVIFAALTTLSACSGKVEKAETNPRPIDSPSGPGLFSGDNGNLLDAFRDKDGGKSSGLPVNAFLWRAALEAISFMPLAEVDSSGGVITTDWYQNPNAKMERIKLTVLVLGITLRPQTLKVQMFKQKLQGGKWVDVAPSTETVSQLEETILTNARILRVKERASH